MSNRFHIPGSLAPGPLMIDGPEAHHLAHVCRLAVGDALTLFNGDGCEYPAQITGIERRRVMVEVGSGVKIDRELGFPLTIAAPLSKGERTAFLIEKLTELGVTAFVPLSSRRSVVKTHDSKLEKLERYVIEASKQCGRNVLMSIAPATTWEAFCRRGDMRGRRILAHPGGVGTLDAGSDRAAGLTFAVGPEGDFTEEEVQWAVAAGWELVDLGPRMLRIETAAIALASSVAIHFRD